MNPRLLIPVLIMLLPGCGYLGHVLGFGPDPQVQRLERRVVMLEHRQHAALEMASTLVKYDPLKDAPMVLVFGRQAIAGIVHVLNGHRDTLEDGSSYVIRGVEMELANGAAIATLETEFVQPSNNLRAELLTDCLIVFEKESEALRLTLVPFNISPNVDVDTWVPGADGYAEQLASERIAQLGQTFPPLRIPLKLENSLSWPGTRILQTGKPNLEIRIPELAAVSALSIGDVFIFENALLVTVKSVEVRP